MAIGAHLNVNRIQIQAFWMDIVTYSALAWLGRTDCCEVHYIQFQFFMISCCKYSFMTLHSCFTFPKMLLHSFSELRGFKLRQGYTWWDIQLLTSIVEKHTCRNWIGSFTTCCLKKHSSPWHRLCRRSCWVVVSILVLMDWGCFPSQCWHLFV